jgi:hypothetical protein
VGFCAPAVLLIERINIVKCIEIKEMNKNVTIVMMMMMMMIVVVVLVVVGGIVVAIIIIIIPNLT